MPAVKGKDGPLPSKTLQFTDFKKGMMRTGGRHAIPPDGLWQSLNAQVIGPGRVQTLTDPGASIATLSPTGVSLWGVMMQIDKVARIEAERLIAILSDGSALSIDPATGASVSIAPAGSLDTDARVTMWRDTHVLFAGETKGLASWDGTTFLSYPAAFYGTTANGSSAVVWVDGPTPVDAITPGMAIAGTGVPPGTSVLGVGGAGVIAGGTFVGDVANTFPTVLWGSGPVTAAQLDSGVGITGTGIPANTTILSVLGASLLANSTFLANTISGSAMLVYRGGATLATDLVVGLRVVGAGIPVGTTILSITAPLLPVDAPFNAKTTSGSNKIDYLGGTTALSLLVPGVVIKGAGIPDGTAVASISGITITLTKNATATAASVGLTSSPTITLGKNATVTATLVSMLTGPTVTLSQNATATGGAVTLTVQPTLTLSNAATADGTVTLTIAEGCPKGTDADPESAGPRDLAVFEGRLWLVTGPRGIVFSGPGSFTLFGPTYAGSATTMPDSIFPGAITTIKAAIQLLWIFGPGAINTISNVQVVSGITIFHNENLVAGTGTTFADSVAALFRTMTFLSPPGVYAILGATPQKLSDQLDGMMPLVDAVGSCPSAVFNLNALLVYGVLVDVEGARRLMIYSRPTWLLADQGPLVWITPLVRSDGEIQCWGTDGTHVMQLFAGPAGDWDVRLRHYDFDMFTRRDTMRRFAVMAETIPNEVAVPFDPDVQVELENESGAIDPLGGVLQGAVTWVNDLGQEIPWFNADGDPVTWVAEGTLFYLSEAKFSGQLLSAHIFGRRSVPLIMAGVAMEVGFGGEWTFPP